MLEIQVTDEKAELRLDKYLSQLYPDFSRSYIQNLIEEGYISVNGHSIKSSFRLRFGDRIGLRLPPPSPAHLTPENIPVTIVYEDADLFVVDKPPGLVVYPAPGHPHHTLINALLALYPELTNMGDNVRPGIVHRLDKGTSGLIVVAKTRAAQQNLIHQLHQHTIVKRYLVLVKGHLFPQEGVIEAPVGRDQRNRQRMAVTLAGRQARTRYRVIRYIDGYALIEVTLETGRTHQIRVHFSAAGYPVVGDSVYGVKMPFLSRQFIHACYLMFRSPSKGDPMELSSDLPADLRTALEYLSTGLKSQLTISQSPRGSRL